MAFTPERFTLSLQWTTPGSDGRHTCTARFDTDGRAATTALPGDPDHDCARDLSFRACVPYTPELHPRTPDVTCAGRH